MCCNLLKLGSSCAGAVRCHFFPPCVCVPSLRLALALGDATAQPLPLAAAANELYKKAREGEQGACTQWAQLLALACAAPALAAVVARSCAAACAAATHTDQPSCAALQARAAGYSDADFSAVMEAVARRD